MICRINRKSRLGEQALVVEVSLSLRAVLGLKGSEDRQRWVLMDWAVRVVVESLRLLKKGIVSIGISSKYSLITPTQ